MGVEKPTNPDWKDKGTIVTWKTVPELCPKMKLSDYSVIPFLDNVMSTSS